MRRLAGRNRGLPGALRERRVDAAGVQPADAELAEDVVEIKVLRPHLGDRRVGPVGAAERAADTEAALRKIEAVPAASADAVRLHHADKIGRDAALLNAVDQKLSDFIVGEGRDDRGL